MKYLARQAPDRRKKTCTYTMIIPIFQRFDWQVACQTTCYQHVIPGKRLPLHRKSSFAEAEDSMHADAESHRRTMRKPSMAIGECSGYSYEALSKHKRIVLADLILNPSHKATR